MEKILPRKRCKPLAGIAGNTVEVRPPVLGLLLGCVVLVAGCGGGSSSGRQECGPNAACAACIYLPSLHGRAMADAWQRPRRPLPDIVGSATVTWHAVYSGNCAKDPSTLAVRRGIPRERCALRRRQDLLRDRHPAAVAPEPPARLSLRRRAGCSEALMYVAHSAWHDRCDRCQRRLHRQRPANPGRVRDPPAHRRGRRRPAVAARHRGHRPSPQLPRQCARELGHVGTQVRKKAPPVGAQLRAFTAFTMSSIARLDSAASALSSTSEACVEPGTVRWTGVIDSREVVLLCSPTCPGADGGGDDGQRAVAEGRQLGGAVRAAGSSSMSRTSCVA